MHVRIWMAGAALALLLAGCKGKGSDVPDGEGGDDEDYVNPTLLMGEPPPDRNLDNQAGLIIESPSPVEVLVDGKKVGKTPITVENLTSGEHEVVFLDPDEGRVTMTVNLSSGEYKRVHHASSPDASDARMGGGN
jgi:hypothetical protein